jgi:hypothetical protein
MAKRKWSLIAGFKDPGTRPRYIIWTGVIAVCLCAFLVFALAFSSSRLFCAQVCHKVQDDAIIAYEAGSHSEISCLACHMPVNADPVTFLIHKAQAGISGAVNTLGNKYEMPLNPGSKLSLEKKYMPEGQCTQCHSKNRKITPSAGIIIDHEIHSKKEIPCTVCHNRVAHPENFELTLKTVEGKPSIKHPDFMKMKYCYRCHDIEGKKTAPGNCALCHPADFQLKPANHFEEGFYPKKHAELALEDEKEMEFVKEEAAKIKPYIEAKGGDPKLADPVSYCGSCHVKEKFCNGCHGMEIPHPEEFKTKSHPEAVKTAMDKCIMCHGKPAETGFCDNCHHGSKVKWTFDKAVPWKTQHAPAVVKVGVDACFGTCHEQSFCLDCHTKTKPLPTSHKAATWLHRANPDPTAKDKAIHATSAANIKACEICHGAGGTGSPFCMACHKQPMPHPADFKSFHAKTGRESVAVCQNCHQLKEVCSNCHHKGAKLDVTWRSIHAATVTADCFAKCHKKDYCVACHTTLKALPATHKVAGWTKRAAADQKAGHPAAFKANAENCTYCHGDGGATAAFCNNCHKMPMPHAMDANNKQKFLHKEGFTAKTLDRAACNNCHAAAMCDKCHHDYTGPTPWRTTHDDIIKGGTDPQKCWACHKETYCSYCHVRLIR